jgi:hypothetical protein
MRLLSLFVCAALFVPSVAWAQGQVKVEQTEGGRPSITIIGDPKAAKAFRDQQERAARQRESEAEERRIQRVEAFGKARQEEALKLDVERRRQVLIGYECEPVDKPAYFSTSPCPKASITKAIVSGTTGPIFSNRGTYIGSHSYSDTVKIPIPVKQTPVYSTVGCEEGKGTHARSVTFLDRDAAAALMNRYCN